MNAKEERCETCDKVALVLASAGVVGVAPSVGVVGVAPSAGVVGVAPSVGVGGGDAPSVGVVGVVPSVVGGGDSVDEEEEEEVEALTSLLLMVGKGSKMTMPPVLVELLLGSVNVALTSTQTVVL